MKRIFIYQYSYQLIVATPFQQQLSTRQKCLHEKYLMKQLKVNKFSFSSLLDYSDKIKNKKDSVFFVFFSQHVKLCSFCYILHIFITKIISFCTCLLLLEGIVHVFFFFTQEILYITSIFPPCIYQPNNICLNPSHIFKIKPRKIFFPRTNEWVPCCHESL